MGLIYQLNTNDRVLTLGIREKFIYPFTAPTWTDLRLGVFLSLTKPAADDDQTGLAESLALTDENDHVYFGFKNNSNDTIPKSASTSFAGLVVKGFGFPTDPITVAPSDNAPNADGFIAQDYGGVGTTFWQAYCTDGPRAVIDNATTETNLSNDLGALLFPQTALSAGGYSTFLALRMTRANGTATSVTINRDTSGPGFRNSYFSSSPTTAVIRSHLRTVNFLQASATAIGIVPDALLFYWPFNNSRLRIHALVLEKFA